MDFKIQSYIKQIKPYLVITGLALLVFIVLRLTIFETNPLIPIFHSIYHTYLLLPEWIANVIYKASDAGVYIKNHQMVFDTIDVYHQQYSDYIENYPKNLLYKRWSLLILAVVWLNFSSVKRKIIYSLAFIPTHIIAVVCGLFLLGVTGPRIIDGDTISYLLPTLVGNLFMFLFLMFWVLQNKTIIRNTIKKLGIRIKLSDRKMYDILLVLFFFLLLRNFLIPSLAFKPLIMFLLEITSVFTFLLGYEGYISDDQLIGASGAIELSIFCLGLKTLYLFAASVFLTRPARNQLYMWVYMVSGLLLIFISNIARFVVLFVVAQGENGFERASRYHDIYNVGIYVVIFFMWVLWVELMRRKELYKDDI